jgi:hypothetical protein
MIRGLHSFFDNLHTPVRVTRCLVHDLQKQIFADVIRTRARHEYATRMQKLQRTQIDLFVTAQR